MAVLRSRDALLRLETAVSGTFINLDSRAQSINFQTDLAAARIDGISRAVAENQNQKTSYTINVSTILESVHLTYFIELLNEEEERNYELFPVGQGAGLIQIKGLYIVSNVSLDFSNGAAEAATATILLNSAAQSTQ